MIEFAHRVTSVLALVMVSSLLFWCWRKTSKGDWPRYSAVLAMIFLFNEAFVGAMLVLFGHGWLRGSCSRQFREAFRIEFTGFRYTQDSAPTILTLTGGILFTRRLRRSW